MTAREKKAVELIANRDPIGDEFLDQESFCNLHRWDIEMLLEAMQWQAEQCVESLTEQVVTVSAGIIQNILNAGMEEQP